MLRSNYLAVLLIATFAISANAQPPVSPHTQHQQQGEEGPSTAAPPTVLNDAVLEIAAQPTLIDRLNARYNDTTRQCSNNTSALHCSGLLLRRTTYSDKFAFWTHSPQAIALGAVTLSYLRADAAITGSDITSGFIFMDDATAAAANKERLSALCIYPFMAGTQNANRPRQGCGFRNTSRSPDNDPSSCLSLPPPVTAEKWKSHFERSGSDREAQCSLSVRAPEHFIASLEARRLLSGTANRFGNELLVTTWDDTRPSALPIQTLFYNAHKSGAFETALKLRTTYYNATSQLLPIVRLDLQAPNNRVVQPLLREELGQAAAQALNLRYANVGSSCQGKPALYCNGVILRTTSFAPTFKAWNPSNRSVENGSVSFSYLRKDLGIRTLAWDTLYQGLIFKQLDSVDAPDMYSIKPLCIYPTDAASWYRGEKGCGDHRKYPGDSGFCRLLHVATVAQFKTHFTKVRDDGKNFNERNEHQCSLGIDINDFTVSLQVRQPVLNPAQYRQHNELMVEAWPQNIPRQLPLEAFFYQSKDTTPHALQQAQGMQQDLMNSADGLWIPVIRVDLDDASGEVFSYRATDQR